MNVMELPPPEESAFSTEDALMPRWWADGFDDEEAKAEIIDAVRNIVWTSPVLLKKLPTLKSHLIFAQIVLNYVARSISDSGKSDGRIVIHVSKESKTDLFCKVVSACSALSSTNIDNIINSVLPVPGFDIGLVAVKNRRRLMEDQNIVLPNLSLWPSLSKSDSPQSSLEQTRCALLAVMDGHGGQHASSYVARQLPDIVRENLASDISRDLMHVLSDSLAEVERKFCARASKLGQLRVGSTIVTALINLDSGHGVVGWIGDSRADLFKFCRQNNDIFKCDVVNLTVPLHRPDNDIERKRIEDVGGFVSGISDDCARVNGVLGVSRSIGDLEYKLSGLVSAEPQFSTIYLPAMKDQGNRCCNAHFELLLLSSDGLWDGMNSSDIISVISDSLKREEFRTDPDWLSSVASRLSKMASSKSEDNITCILISRPMSNPNIRLSGCLSK